ncbi:serine hydrolase domain-containing protein [Roseateles sp. DB2]|uniref:serine hydrolase domain-containing protein n=1 Tax=Roseateles sp. DB2 TaxID=3453717 RepID=UPI003EEE9565
MRKQTATVLAAVSICLVAAVASRARAAETAPASEQGDAEVVRPLAERLLGDRTGACVLAAVIERQQVRRARVCAGTREDGPPAWEAALEIGSISKTMTATLVAGLIQSGRWSLDDPIARHLPEGTPVPRQGDRQILVRDLLTHSAGLPALPPGMPLRNPADPYAALTEAGLLEALGRTTLASPIGEQAAYSNFGMMVLSLAVARSTGGDLEATLREQLFKPLSMQAFIVPGPTAPLAPGHASDGRRAPGWTITPNLAGVGMVKASLADMTRYAQAALGEGPEPVVRRLALTGQPLAHGFGMNWMRQAVQGRELLLHEGGTGGFSSFIGVDRPGGRAVVLLADTSLADLGGLGDLGLALLGLDWPVSGPRRAVSTTEAQRQSLAGEYRLGALRLRIWSAEGERLMAQAEGQAAFELHQDSAGDFYPEGFSALLTPLRDAGPDGAVSGLAWRQGGGTSEAVRIRPPMATDAVNALPAGNPAWADWLGEYALTPQFSLRVLEQGGRLMVRGTGQPAIPAAASGPDRLEVSAVDAVVEFERDAAGRVVAAVLLQNGQRLKGQRR